MGRRRTWSQSTLNETKKTTGGKDPHQALRRRRYSSTILYRTASRSAGTCLMFQPAAETASRIRRWIFWVFPGGLLEERSEVGAAGGAGPKGTRLPGVVRDSVKMPARNRTPAARVPPALASAGRKKPTPASPARPTTSRRRSGCASLAFSETVPARKMPEQIPLELPVAAEDNEEV